MAKKEAKARVQFEAPAAEVAQWKKEAESMDGGLSAFLRRAADRYLKYRQQKRGGHPKRHDDTGA